MFSTTEILLIAILIFVLGNIILSYIFINRKRLFNTGNIDSIKIKELDKKISQLNERVNRLEVYLNDKSVIYSKEKK